LRRTVQKELDNRISRLLLDGGLDPGATVQVDTADDDLVVTAQAAANTADTNGSAPKSQAKKPAKKSAKKGEDKKLASSKK
jgi:ATP-dependent Clp protease ATP-binding subunit ClpC